MGNLSQIKTNSMVKKFSLIKLFAVLSIAIAVVAENTNNNRVVPQPLDDNKIRAIDNIVEHADNNDKKRAMQASRADMPTARLVWNGKDDPWNVQAIYRTHNADDSKVAFECINLHGNKHRKGYFFMATYAVFPNEAGKARLAACKACGVNGDDDLKSCSSGSSDATQ